MGENDYLGISHIDGCSIYAYKSDLDGMPAIQYKIRNADIAMVIKCYGARAFCEDHKQIILEALHRRDLEIESHY